MSMPLAEFETFRAGTYNTVFSHWTSRTAIAFSHHSFYG
jgi:hypothetical protein